MKNIAIIGAGITGITTAYQLLERGYTVSVFDKNRYAAMETSFANGGQLSACNAEVWNSWSTIGKGIQWMLKKDAPLLFSPKLSLHKISWIIDFISNIPNHKKNTILTAKMAINSRYEFKRILKKENIDAFNDIIKRLLEAQQRELWKPNRNSIGDQLLKYLEIYNPSY